MTIFRLYFVVLFALMAQTSSACTTMPKTDRLQSLMGWLQSHRPNTKVLKNIPDVVQYHRLARAARIALVAGAREDQLVYELVHAYQHAENPESDSGDDSLEEEAVAYQQQYQKEKGNVLLEWTCSTHGS